MSEKKHRPVGATSTAKGRARRRYFALSAVMAALLSVLCPFVIPVGAIPVTLATLLVFLLAATLPRSVSLSAVSLYLVLGGLGLPVFASFVGGIGVLIGPTGGFLWGYLPAALLVSLADRKSRWQTPLAMLLANLLLYLTGTLQFSLVGGVSFTEALLTAAVPFLLPDLLKLLAASTLSMTLRGRLKKLLQE